MQNYNKGSRKGKKSEKVYLLLAHANFRFGPAIWDPNGLVTMEPRAAKSTPPPVEFSRRNLSFNLFARK